ncbi:hypothetical protein D3C83_228710 [compost metagenome]
MPINASSGARNCARSADVPWANEPIVRCRCSTNLRSSGLAIASTCCSSAWR